MVITERLQQIKGAEWLIKQCEAVNTFTPEDYTEEQRMVREMCVQFLKN